jgi:hypothetical protein
MDQLHAVQPAEEAQQQRQQDDEEARDGSVDWLVQRQQIYEKLHSQMRQLAGGGYTHHHHHVTQSSHSINAIGGGYTEEQVAQLAIQQLAEGLVVWGKYDFDFLINEYRQEKLGMFKESGAAGGYNDNKVQAIQQLLDDRLLEGRSPREVKPLINQYRLAKMILMVRCFEHSAHCQYGPNYY